MRDFKIIAAIADIHIGIKHISADTFKEQLKKHFFDVVKKFPYLDGIFILGDTLHTMLPLNSDSSYLFMWFAGKVYKLARKYHATVVWLTGTIAHDANQLRNLRSYVNNDDGVDFRIYETVEEITLWDDYKVLVLPDVKVKSLKDIDQYLDTPKKYDMILGHGTVKQMEFFVQESENQPTKTYLYDTDKLISASRGPVLFGHIHQYQSYNDHFYYAGPFTLLERGGTDAGFVVVGIYDKDRTKFKVEHYLNPDSAAYHEIVITRDILDTVPIDDLMAAVTEISEEAKLNDLITLRIVRGDETEAADKAAILETCFRKDPRFSIVKKIKSRKETEEEKAEDEKKERYAYLMDQSMDLPSIMYTYYLSDIRPMFPDKTSAAANLKEEDFVRALSN